MAAIGKAVVQKPFVIGWSRPAAAVNVKLNCGGALAPESIGVSCQENYFTQVIIGSQSSRFARLLQLTSVIPVPEP